MRADGLIGRRIETTGSSGRARSSALDQPEAERAAAPISELPPERRKPRLAAAARLAAPRRAVLRALLLSLTRRIVFLNLAGLVALVAGILYLNQFRAGLIDARAQSLLVQGEIIAARDRGLGDRRDRRHHHRSRQAAAI